MTQSTVVAGGRGVTNRARLPQQRRFSLNRISFGFLIPALVVYCAIVIYPSLAGAVYAFTNWSGGSKPAQFTGLENFIRIFQDPEALGGLVNSVIIAISTTIVQTAIGLGLAVALNSRVKSRMVLRMIFFAPVLLPPVVIASLWQYILAPSGPLNSVLNSMHLSVLAQNWLGDSSVALGSVIGVIIWQNTGISMVIFLAGLQGVPAELHEAAELDGASPIQRFKNVTLPLLIPATTIVMSLTLIASLKIFDQVFVMTGGGPGYATQTMSLVMYKKAFVSLEYGYSTAIALVLTMLVFMLALIQFKGLKRFGVDQ